MYRLMLLVMIIVLMVAGCVYPPEWGAIDAEPTDAAMELPPGVSDQPFDLPYPELPWNHVCNVLPTAGGCNPAVEDNPEGY